MSSSRKIYIKKWQDAIKEVKKFSFSREKFSKLYLDVYDKSKDKAITLLEYLNSLYSDTGLRKNEDILQLATAESLTAGLIMSTLVDVPRYGAFKYGCCGVYDTDAKRVFLGVSINDVYTPMCAKQMAIGLLKNSNATIAIAVSGNAMAVLNQKDRIGEVFIGIAGYRKNNTNYEYIYETYNINTCLDKKDEDIEKGFLTACLEWYNTSIHKDTKININPSSDLEHSYASASTTSLINQLIRNYVTYKALDKCYEFIKKYIELDSINNLIVPSFIKEQKNKNNETQLINSGYITKTEQRPCRVHTDLPLNKYNKDLPEICLSDKENICEESNNCHRLCDSEKEFDETTNRCKTKFNAQEKFSNKRTEIHDLLDKEYQSKYIKLNMIKKLPKANPTLKKSKYSPIDSRGGHLQNTKKKKKKTLNPRCIAYHTQKKTKK